MLILYNLLFPFVAVLYLFLFLMSPRRSLLKNILSEIRERLGLYPNALFQEMSHHHPLWFHAASVGEVKLLCALLPQFKDRKILVTTSSTLGRDLARQIPEITWALIAPLDFYPLTSRAMRKISPQALILVETEIWPNLITSSNHHGVPLFLINGRISDKSFPRYRYVKSFLKQLLSRIQLICVQTEAAKQRFLGLGALPQSIHV
ncbi:MAG: hypothetical protein HY400_05200, partial [Elusimicrobia bacterium]|nr:hypothetical protein [Elusimicrobiota bacterium]